MIIGAIIILLIIVVAGAYFLTSAKSAAKSSTVTIINYPSTTSQASTTAQASTTGASTAASTTQATTTVNANATKNTTSYTVNLENSSTVGEYLANSSGFTLYTYNNDVPNSNASTCYGSCASNWPPFYTATLSLAPGLNASNFGTITRTGGGKQITYKGRPLYFFVGDTKAGDRRKWPWRI